MRFLRTTNYIYYVDKARKGLNLNKNPICSFRNDELRITVVPLFFY